MVEVETCLGAPSVAAPAEVVGGKDPGRPAPLGFEREESVPGSNVENSCASHVLGKVERLQLFRGVVIAWGDNTVTQIDLVEPPDLGDCTPQLRNVGVRPWHSRLRRTISVQPILPSSHD